MDLVLDLNNFESAEAEGSRYVLTSPKSLEACARMNVRPIQLLRKPLEDFMEENPGKAVPLLQVLHDDHEKKRLDLLRKCQDVRRTLMMEAKLESKKGSSEHGRIVAELRAAEGQNKDKNTKVNSQIPATRSKSNPQQKKKREKLAVSKSLGDYRQCEDVNNNDALYEVISNRSEVPKVQNKMKISKKNETRPSQNVSRFSPGQATFTKSKHLVGKRENEEAEQPYMISTPRIPKKFTSSTVKTLDKSWRSRAKKPENEEAKAEDNIEPNTSRSPRSLSSFSDLHLRTRSRSLDARVRRKSRKTSDFELASSLKLTSSRLTSGYSTPQMQKDQKIVEVMKDKRKQEEDQAKQRFKKHLEWAEQQKIEEKKKFQEGTQMRKDLAMSHLEWEKRIKERDEKRVRELRRIEEEREQIQLEMEKRLKENKEYQERLRLQIIEEKKKTSLLRKQQQKEAKDSIERDVLAFQEATQQEIEEKMQKAQKSKLEMELKELNKIQTMSTTQRERCLQLQKQLRKRREEEEEKMRNSLQNKMEKAEILHVRKLSEREQNLKEQMREEEKKLKQTKSNQEKITKETEEYLQSIAEHKKELLKRANTTALKNIQSKSKRAQQMREISQEEHKRKLKQIEEEDEKYLIQTKEDIEMKENRAKTHQQLKETAIQLSRAHARATEVARLEVRRKDDTFLDAVKQAQLNASIGKGVRTGAVNASSVKFG